MLIVTRGDRMASVPLRMWREGEHVYFGCRGPSPRFAHRADSTEALAESIVKTLGK